MTSPFTFTFSPRAYLFMFFLNTTYPEPISSEVERKPPFRGGGNHQTQEV